MHTGVTAIIMPGTHKKSRSTLKSFALGGRTAGKKTVVRALHVGELTLDPKQTDALAKALKIKPSDRPRRSK